MYWPQKKKGKAIRLSTMTDSHIQKAKQAIVTNNKNNNHRQTYNGHSGALWLMMFDMELFRRKRIVDKVFALFPNSRINPRSVNKTKIIKSKAHS